MEREILKGHVCPFLLFLHPIPVQNRRWWEALTVAVLTGGERWCNVIDVGVEEVIVVAAAMEAVRCHRRGRTMHMHVLLAPQNQKSLSLLLLRQLWLLPLRRCRTTHAHMLLAPSKSLSLLLQKSWSLLQNYRKRMTSSICFYSGLTLICADRQYPPESWIGTMEIARGAAAVVVYL